MGVVAETAVDLLCRPRVEAVAEREVAPQRSRRGDGVDLAAGGAGGGRGAEVSEMLRSTQQVDTGLAYFGLQGRDEWAGETVRRPFNSRHLHYCASDEYPTLGRRSIGLLPAPQSPRCSLGET
jgi:hypothetical protein